MVNIFYLLYLARRPKLKTRLIGWGYSPSGIKSTTVAYNEHEWRIKYKKVMDGKIDYDKQIDRTEKAAHIFHEYHIPITHPCIYIEELKRARLDQLLKAVNAIDDGEIIHKGVEYAHD